MLGDDYCSMYIGERLGLLRSIWYWYLSWHGGLSASAADWLLSLWGSGVFRFNTFIFLSTWVVFAAIAVKKAIDYRGYSSSSLCPLLLAIFLIFTTLSISPDISQSLFWWGGARGYLSPLILFTLYFALYYHFLASSPNRVHKTLWVFVSFGLAFLIGGFSETFTPAWVVLLAGIIGVEWFIRKWNVKDPSFLFLVAGFAGALLSLFVMVLAPGNSSRQSYFPAAPDIFTILRMASTSYLAFLYGIFSTYRILGVLGSLFGAVWLGLEIRRGSSVTAPRGWWILAFLLAGFILAFGCFPPAVYGTSEPPPARTLIIPSFFLMACFLVSGFIFGEWLASRIRGVLPLPAALSIIACSLIIISSWNTFQSLYSVRSEYISFAEQWDLVDAKIRAAKTSGAQEIVIPSLKNWAGLEYPTDNPRYWPNVCYSKYYDIDVLASPRQP